MARGFVHIIRGQTDNQQHRRMTIQSRRNIRNRMQCHVLLYVAAMVTAVISKTSENEKPPTEKPPTYATILDKTDPAFPDLEPVFPTTSDISADMENETVCKNIVAYNITSLIASTAYTTQRCKRCKNGYRWVKFVRYRNITKSGKRTEHVCCEGFRNESGSCIEDIPVLAVNGTALDVIEGQITLDASILFMIILPLVAGGIILVLVLLIRKTVSTKKRIEDTHNYAHDNPTYDSIADPTYASIGDEHLTYEYLNPNMVEGTNEYTELEVYHIVT